jgi:precorrin-6Y C5,15-methyltransferase (decarboxylating)
VLASGDPCYFGIGPLLVERLGRARVEIVPHVSSVALAFARLGIGWQDARVVSAHGRPLDAAIQAARGAHKLAVLTDETNTPAVIAGALLEAGAENCDAWVFEHLGGARESEIQATLLGLTVHACRSLNVLVVPRLTWACEPIEQDAPGREHRPAPSVDPIPQRMLPFGLPEAEYDHHDGMVTKPEVRAVTLSKLHLRPGGVLWDVGSGSGSVAIEAAGLASGLHVFAVERAPRQLDVLRRNVLRFGGNLRIEVVVGSAPAALVGLPDPDAVFVGGSGGKLSEILAIARSRLRPGGRIVLNLVTYEHIAEVLAWARTERIEAEIVQLGVARGSGILELTRLQAENPVTIVTVTP